MTNEPERKTLTELREQMRVITGAVAAGTPYTITANGHPLCVMVPFGDWNHLASAIEDWDDTPVPDESAIARVLRAARKATGQ